ncbi:MAG: family 16 glycoside hydrolase [Bacteroidales bacterium]
MKNFATLLIACSIVVSCNRNSQVLHPLEETNRWQGEGISLLSEGVLEMNEEYSTVVYNPGFLNTFRNFELSTEVQTMPGGSAAILFHTNKRDLEQGYEVNIDNSEVGSWDQLLKTGSLSNVRNIYYNMVEDGSWFKLVIMVVENKINITVNGYPVVDYIEPEIPFRTAQLESRKLGTGTFAIRTLFGNSGVKFRNMTITNLPPAEKRQNDDPDFAREITQLHSRLMPVVDYHVHEKGDLTIAALIERSAKMGINYGVAANCGLKFPIETNEQLEAYHASIQGLPIFKAMQAEGREWVGMFSPELVARFDYAFTDAMTWTNRNGTRMRLWIPEETEVGDPQDFMEQLVSQIEMVVTEPVAIYVNPTYLPVELEDRYDELWTDARIDRVVNALVENNVALEINSKLRLPGSRVIAKAKEAGVKFALGTNNTDSKNLGNLEWARQMVEEHNLQPSHMYLPGQK